MAIYAATASPSKQDNESQRETTLGRLDYLASPSFPTSIFKSITKAPPWTLSQGYRASTTALAPDPRKPPFGANGPWTPSRTGAHFCCTQALALNQCDAPPYNMACMNEPICPVRRAIYCLAFSFQAHTRETNISFGFSTQTAPIFSTRREFLINPRPSNFCLMAYSIAISPGPLAGIERASN